MSGSSRPSPAPRSPRDPSVDREVADRQRERARDQAARNRERDRRARERDRDRRLARIGARRNFIANDPSRVPGNAAFERIGPAGIRRPAGGGGRTLLGGDL